VVAAIGIGQTTLFGEESQKPKSDVSIANNSFCVIFTNIVCELDMLSLRSK
jgi:hypothetical protein